jgi:hypothetical protein
MSSSKPKRQSDQRGAAQPASFRVPIQVLETQKMPNGQTSLVVNMDISDAPAPSAKFVADRFCIARDQEDWRIVFAQSTIDGSGVRAIVDLHMPQVDYRAMADNFMVIPSSERAAKPFALQKEPAETVAVYANIGRAGHGPHGGFADFFAIAPPPFGAAQADPKEVVIEPVVRIVMPEAMLFGLVDEMRRLRQEKRDA